MKHPSECHVEGFGGVAGSVRCLNEDSVPAARAPQVELAFQQLPVRVVFGVYLNPVYCGHDCPVVDARASVGDSGDQAIGLVAEASAGLGLQQADLGRQ